MPTWLESTTSSHSSSIGNIARQWSPNSLTLFVSNPMRRPRAFSSRILCTTIQCTPGAVVRQKRPYASMSIGVPSTAGAFSTMRSKYVAMSIWPFSSRCQSGSSATSPSASAASGSAAIASATGATLDADVVRLAEQQPQQRALRVALGLLELADADEQRARDDAAEVEDDRADRHAGEVSDSTNPPGVGKSTGPDGVGIWSIVSTAESAVGACVHGGDRGRLTARGESSSSCVGGRQVARARRHAGRTTYFAIEPLSRFTLQITDEAGARAGTR